MKKLLTIFCLFVSFLAEAQGPQTAIYVKINTVDTIPALIYLPNEYADSSTKKYAILIFFHGTGEASSTPNLAKIYNNTNLAGGPAYFIAHGQWPTAGFTNPSDGKIYKFIVVSPQAKSYSVANTQIPYLLTDLKNKYRIDTNRIYLTGLSAGGDGLENYCFHTNVTPNYKAAAIVPMSAATSNPSASPQWAQAIVADSVKAWAFGDAGNNPGDPFGTYEQTLIGQMNAIAPGIGRFTTYNGGHCCWDNFYNPNYKETINGVSMNPYEWMLQYTRSAGVAGGNQPPSVSASASSGTITLPTSSVTLTASASDVDGTISSYSWTKVFGGAYAFSTPSNSSTSVINLTAGAYQFRVTVTDNQGATASAVVNVQVNPAGTSFVDTLNVNIYGNSDPYNASNWNDWNISSSLSIAALKYRGGSTSAIGAILSAQTSYADNTSGYTGFSMCPDKVGRYGSYSGSSRTLTLSGLDNSKVYDIVLYSSRSGRTDSSAFTINGTRYAVYHGNNKSTAVTFSSIYPTGGNIVVTIANGTGGAFNYLNGFSIIEKTPTGGATNQCPIAAAGQDQTITLPTNNVTLNGTGSTDDHTIASYRWKKLNGTGGTIVDSTAASTDFTGLAAGSYSVELKVTDDSACVRRDTMQITVNAASNTPPIASAGGNKTIKLPATSITVDANASSDDGSIVGYMWETISGPTAQGGLPAAKTWATPGGRSFILTPDAQGYKIIDNAGGTYIAGDTLYFQGSFKQIAISNMSGAAGNYIVITNRTGQTLTIGDSTWSGGAYAQGLVLRNCHYIEVSGTSKTNFQIVGSKSDVLDGNGVPVRTAYTDFAASEKSDNFAVHDLSIRHGGPGLFAKTEVLSNDPLTWYPYRYLNNWEFYNLDISNTYNEAMYIGHTAAYWNINTNTPAYPQPGETYQNDTSIYKRPIKLTNVSIHDNYIHDIGNDAMQTAAIDTLEVYNNEITNWATKHGAADNGGILIGGRVKGFNVHDNYVHDGWGELMQIYAEGHAQSVINNNLLIRNGSNDGVSIRGTDSLAVTFTNNTVAYVGNNLTRVNGYFGGVGTNLFSKNILAQPLMTGGTIFAKNYIYTENGGKVSETASPNDNKKFATGAEVNWDEGNFFFPNTGSTAAGYGYVRNVQNSIGYTHTIVSPNASSTLITGLILGVYTIRITVTDNLGATGYQDFTITLNPANPAYIKLPGFGRIKFSKPNP